MRFILFLLILSACGRKDGPIGTLITFDERGCSSALLVKWTGEKCEVIYDGVVVYSSIPINVTYHDGWLEIDQDTYTHGIVGVK